MSNESAKTSLDLSSIINLKAELVKKQEEFRLKKLSQNLNKDEYESQKTLSTWGKKKNIAAKETNQEPSKQVKAENEDETEEKLLEKSRKMLESKAKYYEEVVSGKKMTEEGDEEIFLVDFDKKAFDENQLKIEEEEELKKESLKLKNIVDEEEYNRSLKEKWDQESNQNLDKEKIHYQDIRFNEVRYMGVGNYQFSRDEEERKKQMEFFKNIELESKTSRITNEIYKLKREKLLVERLSKVKQRRLLKFGYNLDKIKEMCSEFDKELEEIEKEVTELENTLKNPQLLEIKQKGKETDIDDFDKYKPSKKNVLDREWDKPKLKEKIWVKHVEKLRNERNKQFAPPSKYDSNKKKSQNQKKKNKKNKKDEESEDKKQKNENVEKENKFSYNPAQEFTNFNIPPPPIPPTMFFYPPPPFMSMPMPMPMGFPPFPHPSNFMIPQPRTENEIIQTSSSFQENQSQ